MQVFAPEHAARLVKLKKNDLASEAERLAVSTGWLPVILLATVKEAPAETFPDSVAGEKARASFCAF